MATWNIDTVHSNVDFIVRHMMVTNVRGTFDEVSGTIEFDPENPAATTVDVSVNVASVNTGAADRDNHLRSADFFEVEKFPAMTFKSTGVEITSDTTATMTGDLTIRDVTRPVTLQVEYLGTGSSPFGDVRAGFEATGKINREDFGLTWNQALEAGGVLVGQDVKLQLAVQGVRQGEPAAV